MHPLAQMEHPLAQVEHPMAQVEHPMAQVKQLPAGNKQHRDRSRVAQTQRLHHQGGKDR